MKIVWSPLAVERIEEISDYIAEDDPAAAGRWVDSILEKIERLQHAPELGRIVPEVGAANIRELVFGNYRIIYRLRSSYVELLTVRSFSQILPLRDIGDEGAG